MFANYIKSITNAKMMEVCSTTLPQKAIPRVFDHPAYADHLMKRRKRYERFSEIGYGKLKDIPGIMVNQTNGAFYMTVVFEEGRINRKQTLAIANPEVRELIENLTAKDEKMQLDKRFVYYLLGATGICVVPLTSFSSDLQGFRVTLLETEEQRFAETFDTLRESIKQYLASA
jgi:aspartate/methionine/tyrosine aminotransferase